MKSQTTKKLFSFITVIMLSISTLVFYNSCKKETSRDTIKTNAASKTGTTIRSKIIYTDVIQDSMVKCTLPVSGTGSCSSIFYLDVNKDGINDFSITLSKKTFLVVQKPYAIHYNKTNSNISVTSLNGNMATDSIKYLANFIDGSLNWSNNLLLLASTVNPYHVCGGVGPIPFLCWGEPIISGSWSGQTDKYLPLRLIVGTITYYGWARLDVAAGGTSFTIKDYAYNSTPNQSILAGQTK